MSAAPVRHSWGYDMTMFERAYRATVPWAAPNHEEYGNRNILTAPQMRVDPDFDLEGFVQMEDTDEPHAA